MINKTEKDIMGSWNPKDPTLLSICCITYNHESFIADTLDSFLMQETDFPFEIIIGEDCSSDNTREVIKKYQNKFPNLIRVIESEHNVGMHKNYFRTHYACKSPYIAFCEGDDYWTDPKKLSIQVSFLENNPEYVISGHDAFTVDENGKKIGGSLLSELFKKDISKHDYIKQYWVLTMSRVYRNVITEFPKEMYNIVNIDYFHLYLLDKFGKRKFHDDIKNAAYRKHSGGIWSSLLYREQKDQQINSYFWIYKYYRRIGNKEQSDLFWNNFCRRVLYAWIKRLRIYIFLKKICPFMP